MKYGFVLPRGDARTAADFAHAAGNAGWDGFFVWEPVWGVDAWVCLTAAACATTAHPDQGSRRLAGRKIDATRPALRWPAASCDRRGR